MNSLQQLNGWGSQPLFYTDDRPTTVSFTSETNQSIYVPNSTQAFTSPNGIAVSEVISAQSTGYVEIDTRAVGTPYLPTVTWSSLPSGFVATQPTPGVYRVTGLLTVDNYNLIKNPTITYPAAYHGPATSYTIFANFSGELPADPNASSQITVTVNWTYIAPYGFSYEEDNNLSLTGFNVADQSPTGNTYSVNVRLNPNIGNLLIGATNYGSNLTLSANTQANINTSLANLVFSPTPQSSANANVQFSLTRTSTGTLLANLVAIPIVSTGDLPEPTFGNISYSNSISNDNNNRDSFDVTQVVYGSAGFPMVADGFSYSVPTVSSVNTQPTITSGTAVVSGNDLIVRYQGYWQDSRNTAKTAFNNSFNIITTAKNNKNQFASSTKSVSLHNDIMTPWTWTSTTRTSAGTYPRYFLWKINLPVYFSGNLTERFIRIYSGVGDWQNIRYNRGTVPHLTQICYGHTPANYLEFQNLPLGTANGNLASGYRYKLLESFFTYNYSNSDTYYNCRIDTAVTNIPTVGTIPPVLRTIPLTIYSRFEPVGGVPIATGNLRIEMPNVTRVGSTEATANAQVFTVSINSSGGTIIPYP